MDFTQSMDNGYMIPTSVAVGSGEATDIRCVCDTVEDFKTFLDATEMDLRYEGLITYEKVNKLLKVYKGNDTWQTVGEGGESVDTSSFITLTQLSQQLSNYYTKAQTDNKISEEIAKAQLGGDNEVDLSAYATKVFVNDNFYDKGEVDAKIEDSLNNLSNNLPNLNGILLDNAETYLKIPTYDGSDQIVHCKVLYFKHKWNGYNFWMAHTPLPYVPTVDESKENPCIMASNDGENWVTPEGLTNPLDFPDNYPNDYMSDAHLVYNPKSNKLEIWYRQYIKNPTTEIIWRRTSANGVDWTEKEEVIRSNSQNDIVSPSVIYDEDKYKIWFVGRNGASYCLRYFESEDGLNPKFVRNMDIGNANLGHCDVIKSSKGYECVCHIRGDQSCVYSFSADNVTWTQCTEILKVKEGAWDNNKLYRPNLTIVGNKYYLYYTGGLAKQGAKIGLIKIGKDEPSIYAKDIIQDDDNMFVNREMFEKLLNLDIEDILNRIVLLENSNGGEVVRVEGVSLNITSHTMNVGETLQLNHSIQPSNATNKNVHWSVNNENCIVENGLVTPKVAGEYVVTVTTQDGNKTSSCLITATEPDSNTDESLILYLNASMQGDVAGYWKDLSPSNQTVVLEGFADGGTSAFANGKLKLVDTSLQRAKVQNIKKHFQNSLTFYIKYNSEKASGKLFGDEYNRASSCSIPAQKAIYWRGNKSVELDVSGFAINTDTAFVVTHDVVTKECKFYKNGALVASGTVDSNDTITNGDIYIGASDVRYGSGNHFKGYIYEVKMYNRVLSDAEISNL